MPGFETARAALDALCAHMAEVAEAGNDAILSGQAHPDADKSARIAGLAADLASIAQAAATLTRSLDHETR